ncbi:hypothetical protein F0259_03390 [Vibrio cyclitrophicus]|nr:hypothetical protein [Vibrio cyclitrophicus]TKF44137.1 hypothetical protein FCV49_12900 [Vibrio sp. F13]NOH42864.1 hypothetical protein [Vibrio cyclitrophicus]QCI70609.1 hypothetical protein FAZ90_05810 [Vibrio cyclitrophicus]TKF51516.1 hypothetical protein FCV60_17210 [Vibrio sp. F13]
MSIPMNFNHGYYVIISIHLSIVFCLNANTYSSFVIQYVYNASILNMKASGEDIVIEWKG